MPKLYIAIVLWYKFAPRPRSPGEQHLDFKIFGGSTMSRVCQVTGKRPMAGNNVSHANNRTRRRFLPNLQAHRFWVASENRWVRLRTSTKGMRIIDKNGIDSVLKDMRSRGEKV